MHDVGSTPVKPEYSAAAWYRGFAEREAAGQSALYEHWALGVADDAEVLALLAELPRPKQQPNLLFACARLLGCPEEGYVEWRRWLLAHWPRVSAEMRARSTQTNEPRRCALLMPLLAAIDGPLALLEVGASAGLCLYPDRYSYLYRGVDAAGEPTSLRLDPANGPSTVLLECDTTGEPATPIAMPTRMPEIVGRAGIDLNPLDLTRDDDALWLETLIWPEQHERRERIRAASALVRADPPRIVRGDATAALPALAAEAPSNATLVVVTSASIVYLTPENRAAFLEEVAALPGHWISNEGRGIVPTAASELGETVSPRPGLFVLALDGHPVAFAGPHGQSLDWL